MPSSTSRTARACSRRTLFRAGTRSATRFSTSWWLRSATGRGAGKIPAVRKMLLALVLACGAAVGLAGRQAAVVAPPARAGGPPRLLVMLVVDQFAYEYIDLYGQQWTHGLHRLFENGALFTNARYPYATTVTCPGHSSIGTGVVPAVHGLINNTWY